MFTSTDNPLLSFVIHYDALWFGLGLLCFVVALVVAVFPLKKTSVIAFGLGLALFGGSFELMAQYPAGNLDVGKVVSAIEEQTALESVYIEDDYLRMADRIVSDEDDLSRIPDMAGYTNSREVTFKVTLDPETGEITNLVVVSPAEAVSVDDLLTAGC